MKFDTPATTNPIDQLKVVGQPDRPHRRPAQDDRHRALCLRAARRRRQPGLWLRRRRGDRQGPDRVDGLDAAKAAPGVLAIVTADNAGKLDKGDFNTAKLLGGPEIEHYHQAIALVVAETFEQARAAAQLVRGRLRRSQTARSISPRRRTPRRKPRPTASAGRPTPRSAISPARSPRRRSSSTRPTRRPTRPRDDGAARLDRRVGRRQAHALDVQPDDRLGHRRRRQDARHCRRRTSG